MVIEFLKFLNRLEGKHAKTCLIDESTGYTLSVNQLKEQIMFFGSVLQKNGINSKDKVCLFAENHPNYTVFEQAILSINAVCVPRGGKTPLSELEYIYQDSDSIAIITDSAYVVSHFLSSNNENLKFILYFGNEENNLADNPKVLKYSDFVISNPPGSIETEDEEDQLAFILYTSGTSGFPKGAMINSSAIDYEIKALQERFEIKPKTTSVCVHPLWHSGARIYNLLFLQSGCNVVYTPFKNYIQTIKKYSPDYLQCVPKSIYCIYEEYRNNISEFNVLYKSIFKFYLYLSLNYRNALRLLKKQNAVLSEQKCTDYIQAYLKVILLYLANYFAKRVLFSRLRNKILKDNAVIFTGAAKLSDAVQDFFDAIDIKIIGSYGLTEASPLLVHDKIDSLKYYSSGFPLMDTDIKIVDPNTLEKLGPTKVGMILAKGSQIMQGYYKKEEETNKILMPDGYLKTGDLGWLTADNYLTVISRYDDTIVLSNGLNIDSVYIEEQCLKSTFIEQIVIVGNARLYLSALCKLNEDEYIRWCKQKNLQTLKPNENKEFKEHLLTNLNELISQRKNFVPYEKIKNIFFVDDSCSFENGLMTNTGKLKRIEINKLYAKQIEMMYNNIV